MTWEYVEIEEDFRYVRFESLNLGHTPPEHTLPEVHLLTQLGGMLSAGRQKPVADMPQAALDNLGDASMRFAYPILRSLYAHALWLRGDMAAATAQLGLIRGMYGETVYLGTLERMRAEQTDGAPPLPPVPKLPRKEGAPLVGDLPKTTSP